jgi:hypothetical protein
MPWIATVVSVSLLAAGAVPNAGPPEIYSLNPSEGPAGTVITVKGTGFSRTRHVLFCAGLSLSATHWLNPTILAVLAVGLLVREAVAPRPLEGPFDPR